MIGLLISGVNHSILHLCIKPKCNDGYLGNRFRDVFKLLCSWQVIDEENECQNLVPV